VVGGAFVAALVLSSAIAVMFVRRHAPRLVLMGGTMLLASGLAITLAGIYLHSTAILFLGTAIAGLGFGAAFNGSIRSLAPLASQNERAGLMSGFFALSYLAFSVPAILAGLGVGHFGLQTTSLFFGAALIVLALFALISMQREAQ
jgi:MFS family permease